MRLGIDFESPKGMGVGMGLTFENGCGYSYTRSMPIPMLEIIGMELEYD